MKDLKPLTERMEAIAILLGCEVQLRYLYCPSGWVASINGVLGSSATDPSLAIHRACVNYRRMEDIEEAARERFMELTESCTK